MRAICLWCTVVHVLVFALFILIVRDAFPHAHEERGGARPLIIIRPRQRPAYTSVPFGPHLTCGSGGQDGAHDLFGPDADAARADRPGPRHALRPVGDRGFRGPEEDDRGAARGRRGRGRAARPYPAAREGGSYAARHRPSAATPARGRGSAGLPRSLRRVRGRRWSPLLLLRVAGRPRNGHRADVDQRAAGHAGVREAGHAGHEHATTCPSRRKRRSGTPWPTSPARWRDR